jgi:hypothetical protein
VGDGRDVTARRRATAPWVAAWCLFAAYFLAARGAGNFFPLSVFDMYQGRPPSEAARVVVVDAVGEASELDDWDAFQCEAGEVPLTATVHCGRRELAIAYVARDQQRFLDAHRGAGGEARVSIVSRTYRLEPQPGEAPYTDCELARCAARRRTDP